MRGCLYAALAVIAIPIVLVIGSALNVGFSPGGIWSNQEPDYAAHAESHCAAAAARVDGLQPDGLLRVEQHGQPGRAMCHGIYRGRAVTYKIEIYCMQLISCARIDDVFNDAGVSIWERADASDTSSAPAAASPQPQSRAQPQILDVRLTPDAPMIDRSAGVPAVLVNVTNNSARAVIVLGSCTFTGAGASGSGDLIVSDDVPARSTARGLATAYDWTGPRAGHQSAEGIEVACAMKPGFPHAR